MEINYGKTELKKVARDMEDYCQIVSQMYYNPDCIIGTVFPRPSIKEKSIQMKIQGKILFFKEYQYHPVY